MRTPEKTDMDKIIRGMKISPTSKLTGMRLLNELADRVLSKKQKLMRRKLRNSVRKN